MGHQTVLHYCALPHGYDCASSCLASFEGASSNEDFLASFDEGYSCSLEVSYY